MKRKFRSNVLHLAALLAASVFAFTGCGGGADTTENPVTTGPTAGPTYSGPAPATADIQAFRVAFWENVRGTNRCGNCRPDAELCTQRRCERGLSASLDRGRSQ
jgi:hypothetical protein